MSTAVPSIDPPVIRPSRSALANELELAIENPKATRAAKSTFLRLSEGLPNEGAAILDRRGTTHDPSRGNGSDATAGHHLVGVLDSMAMRVQTSMSRRSRRAEADDPTIYPEEERVGEEMLQRWIAELLRPLHRCQHLSST